MKRDMDLVRDLLLRIEALDIRAGSALMLEAGKEPLAREGDDPDSIAYHMHLLMKADLIDPTKMQGADSFGIRGLTWSGHDFLETIRDPVIWHQTKEGAKKAGGFCVPLQGIQSHVPNAWP